MANGVVRPIMENFLAIYAALLLEAYQDIEPGGGQIEVSCEQFFVYHFGMGD